jgi:hypothetical protein
MSVRDDWYELSSHELTECWVGVAPRAKSRKLRRRYRPHYQSAKATNLPLMTFHLREPPLKAAGAQSWLHPQHSA